MFYFRRTLEILLIKIPVNQTFDLYKWQLVPVIPQPVRNDPLETGVYRIRNLNGESLLTMPSDDQVDKDVYVRSQLDQSPYQRVSLLHRVISFC